LGALSEMEEAVRINPEDSANYEELGVAHAALGMREEAIEDFGRAIELNPGQARYYRLRANELCGIPRFEGAIADARRALEIDPDHYLAYPPLLRAYRGLGQPEKSREALADLAAASVTWADTEARTWALVQSAREHFSVLDDPQTALAEASRAIEIDPANANTLDLRVRIRQALNDERGAEADCEAFARVVLDVTAKPETRLLIWRLGPRCNRWDLMQEGAERLVDDFPRWPAVYFGRAIVDMDLGHFDAALEGADRVIELAPRGWRGYQLRGVIHDRMNRWDEALRDFARALQLSPSKSINRFNYSSTLFSVGRPEEALAEIEHALELSPDSAAYHVERVGQLANLGRCNEARDALHTLGSWPSRFTSFEQATLASAFVYRVIYGCPQAYDSAAALSYARAAVAARPEPMWEKVYGAALYHDGEYEQAKQILLAAVEKEEEEPRGLFLLALTSAMQGSSVEARLYFDHAVALMEQYEPRNPVLLDLRREASRLLGIEEGQGVN